MTRPGDAGRPDLVTAHGWTISGRSAGVHDEGVLSVRADPCTFWRRVSPNSVSLRPSALELFRAGVKKPFWSTMLGARAPRHAACVLAARSQHAFSKPGSSGLKTLSGITPESGKAYCLEHLAAAARVPPRHIGDLAGFARALRMMGDCEIRPGGFCDARSMKRGPLVWGRHGRRPSEPAPICNGTAAHRSSSTPSTSRPNSIILGQFGRPAQWLVRTAARTRNRFSQ